MKKHMLKAIVTLLLAGAFFTTGCEGVIQPGEVSDIGIAIRSMSYFQQPTELAKEIVAGPIEAGDPNHPDRPDDITGKETEVYHVVNAQSFQELLYMGSSDQIWLGAILDGNGIPNGEYVPITAARAPLRIGIDAVKLWDGTTPTNVTELVSNPTKNNIEQARSNILGTPNLLCKSDYAEFYQYEVNSESQFNFSLGMKYSGWGASVKSSLDFSTTRKRTQMVAKFYQIAYTLSADVSQGDIGSFFGSGVTWQDIQSSMRGDVSPVIVSSIKYGRMGVLAIQSNYSSSQVSAALKAKFTSIYGSGSGSITAEQQQVLSEIEISVQVFGGSYGGASLIFTSDGFFDWITGCKTSGIGFAEVVPLSYTLTYLKDRTTAKVVLATEYYKRVVVGEDAPVVYPKYCRVRISKLVYNYNICEPWGSNSTPNSINGNVSLLRGYDDYGVASQQSFPQFSIINPGYHDEKEVDIGFLTFFNDGYALEKAYLSLSFGWDNYIWDSGDNEWDYSADGQENKIYLSEFNNTSIVEIPIYARSSGSIHRALAGKLILEAF